MHTLTIRNVHQALPEACDKMQSYGLTNRSRNGAVMMFPGLYVTEYLQPMERVLFHEERDANPFFHLMESIWMLAGRNDVKWISEFSSNIAQFSDDGETFNGAYGHRWRQWFGVDQLEAIVERLDRNPNCRRQVLAMWDGSVDCPVQGTKDVPCNTTAYVQIVEGKLNLTVCNRSNDLIWGAYGANAVHFSVLQEYLAARVGAEVGTYWQVSANTHVYERHFDMMAKLAEKRIDIFETDGQECPYSRGEVQTTKLVSTTRVHAWHLDLARFMDDQSSFDTQQFYDLNAIRMAWRAYKKGEHAKALANLTALPTDSDWRRACHEWIVRRMP